MADKNDEEKKEIFNVQNEILLLGSFFKQPDLYISWGQYIRSKYDFNDEVVKFLYNNFEIYYKTFSQIIDEVKMNTFMSEDKDRLKTYKKYGGFNLIQKWMNLSNIDDFKNYFNIVKKYSLLREYDKQGFSVEKIMNHRKFNEFTALDIYRLIRSKADKINTVILSNEESIILNEGMTKAINLCLISPDIGIPYPYPILNDLFLGIRGQNMTCMGMLSNDGKTRFMIKLAAYLAFVKNEKVLILANEMTEKKIRHCLITTVINNPEFQALHGIKINKPEKEIVLGMYKDKNGEFIYRKIDLETEKYLETKEEYENRLKKESDEYNKVIQVSQWIEDNTKGKLFIKELIEYDDITLDFEIKKHNLVFGIKHIFYDTLKNDNSTIGDWAAFKLTTTKLKELANQLNIYLYGSIQMTDDSALCTPFTLTSNNISNCKQLKHLLDQLCLWKRINKEEYNKYKILCSGTWGDPQKIELDYNKMYYACAVDKNRDGEKKVLVFEVELNLNIWIEKGILVKS